MRRPTALFVFCAFVFLGQISEGQQPAGAACSLPVPAFSTNKPNIFSAQQEQWLGDAQANELEASYDLLPEKDSAELDRIGQKLLAQLPPTPIRYRFRVYEAQDANAFSIAGGYVYVARKLIIDAHSEDEVAGVVAHEIGHIYTRQMPVLFTRGLKARMGVASLGGREDVEDKLQLLLNVPWKDRAGESGDEEDKDELVADNVGLYALTKAGYAPKAFAESLDRISSNKGHTGNFLTDMLDMTDIVSLRVRVARKIVQALPAECGSRLPVSSAEFKVFQEAVREAAVHPEIEATPGLSSFKVDPPMRNQLDQVRFSPDGRYLFAQDQSVIHVLSRSPLKLLFTIPAAGAEPAHFTPDSSHVVFHFRTMRVEKWEVATGKRESFQELVDYDGCLQTSLSPDGKTFVCLAKSEEGTWLKLTDVETGKRFYENKNIRGFGFLGASGITVRRGGGTRVATVAYSQDGLTLLIVSGIKSTAFDLASRKPIKLGGALLNLWEGRVSFVDSNKVVYECHDDAKVEMAETIKLCESSFPEGIPMGSFKMGYQWVEQLTRGNYLLIGPVKDNVAALIDPSTGKASVGFKLDSLDIYDRIVASENENGGIAVTELGSTKGESVDLPPGASINMEAGAFSNDGRFLAYSGRARSSIWDLKTKKRVALMRPFRAVRIDGEEQMFAQYQPANLRPGQNYHIDLTTGKATAGPPFVLDQIQHGNILIQIQAQDKSGDIGDDVVLQVADAASGNQLWAKKFPHGAPAVWQADDETLVLQMDVNSETADGEIKRVGSKLLKASDWKSEWISAGLLIEVINSRTGEIRRALKAPERNSSWRTEYRWTSLYGDYLVVHGASNNCVIYRVADGVRLGAFYGWPIAGDGKMGLVAATNRDQEVTVYDLTNGKRLKSVTLDQIPQTARFVAEKNALLVLTASQRVYTIDLPKAETAQAAAAK